MALVLNADAFRAWTRLCADSLSRTRNEIDALNVFPVPDSDTGTNAYLTFAAGAEAVAGLADDEPLASLVKTYSDGLLTGAKGNSGVILSQLVRACFRDLPLDGGGVTAEVVASSFVAASEAAWSAVGEPVEGTILSVARAAADGATASATAGHSPKQVFSEAAAAARLALARTPEQMERLARAGVVDAGGRALVVVLDSTDQALTGTMPAPVQPRVPVPIEQAGDDFVDGGPAYEVMYLLEADDDRLPALRATLAPLGDSLVVVGGDRLWNVHVHVDDVGAAIEAGMAAGRPYRLAVTHFADQIARQRRARTRGGRAVLVATTGDGLATLCRDAGAEPLEFTRKDQLTVDRMRDAMTATGAEEIIVLANNQRYVGMFEAAAQGARQSGARVAVIPTHAQVQGLAALAVHDPGLPFDDVVVAMSSAAAHAQHGAVTIATEPGMTMVGPCDTGDVLGVVAGDFAVVGGDVAEGTREVLERLLSPSAEMVTLVLGQGGDAAVEQQVEALLRELRPDVDLVVYEGGQENYPLFLAVE